MDDKYVKPYLDASVFIAWLRGEVIDTVDRARIVSHILGDAQNGKHLIVISALTFAEVHKVKGDGKPHLTVDEDKKILAYFEQDFFAIVEVDRLIGEVANSYCREFNIKPNDAIHLACALRAKCDVLLAWDRPLLLRVTHPSIRVEEPQLKGHPSLFDNLPPIAQPPEHSDDKET